MTTLADRPNTALIVIDVQNGVVARAVNRDAVVANIAAAVDKARAAGTPVIWVQHNSEQLVKDADPWRIVPELAPAAGEPIIQKRYGDSFEDTNLEAELARLKVGKLLVTGAQTDACVRATLHGAFTRGYDATLVSDAHTTEDLSKWGAPPPQQVIAHTNLYWRFQAAPGRQAAVVAAKDLAF
jgi:nicotinamidase-related amidase